MGKNSNRNRKQQSSQTQPGDVMTSPVTEIKKEEAQVNKEIGQALAHADKVEIKKEALGLNPAAEPAKTEAKGGVIELVTSIPKTIWNKGIVPAYNFCKGIITRAWGYCVNTYNAEVALFKELGASKYLLGRGGKLMVKTLKIVALVTVAAFLNSMLFNMTGITLFSTVTLGWIAFAALVCIVIKSYLDQTEVGGKFSFKQAGTHIMDSVLAA